MFGAVNVYKHVRNQYFVYIGRLWCIYSYAKHRNNVVCGQHRRINRFPRAINVDL